MVDFLKELAAHLTKASTIIGLGTIVGIPLALFLIAWGLRRRSSMLCDCMIGVGAAVAVVQLFLRPGGDNLSALEINDFFADFIGIPICTCAFIILSHVLQTTWAKRRAAEQEEADQEPAA